MLHVYVFQRRYRVRVHRHVAPHAGSQGYWVMMNSGTANGGVSCHLGLLRMGCVDSGCL